MAFPDFFILFPGQPFFIFNQRLSIRVLGRRELLIIAGPYSTVGGNSDSNQTSLDWFQTCVDWFQTSVDW